MYVCMYVCMYVPLFLHNRDRYMTQPIYILDQHDEAEIIRGQSKKKELGRSLAGTASIK